MHNDLIFRYDPSDARERPRPTTSEEARRTLIEGNQRFSEWMASCRLGDSDPQDRAYIVPCGSLSSIPPSIADVPLQKPFAVVLGCSDARVPTELLFGQGFNDLFVVRVAGNVLGDMVMGSIDFSIQALSESVQVLVVLGHASCGAVKGAVETYMEPEKFWAAANSPSLHMIFRRIFTAVRESDNALRAVWGQDAPSRPGYREALTTMAITLNAAHSAYVLRNQIEIASAEVETARGVEVLFGVFDFRTYQVCMPVPPEVSTDPGQVNLAPAPSRPQQFTEMAQQLAELYRGVGSS